MFDNKTDHREAPVPLTGIQVLEQLESIQHAPFGRSNKRKRSETNNWHNWRKKSVFFQLPYWKHLLVRHNLDVMHIEKNICDSILGTLLEMDGKSKDGPKARLDLEDLKIRKDQHPKPGKHKYEIKKGCYALKRKRRYCSSSFCRALRCLMDMLPTLSDVWSSISARLLDSKLMTVMLYFRNFFLLHCASFCQRMFLTHCLN